MKLKAVISPTTASLSAAAARLYLLWRCHYLIHKAQLYRAPSLLCARPHASFPRFTSACSCRHYRHCCSRLLQNALSLLRIWLRWRIEGSQSPLMVLNGACRRAWLWDLVHGSRKKNTSKRHLYAFAVAVLASERSWAAAVRSSARHHVTIEMQTEQSFFAKAAFGRNFTASKGPKKRTWSSHDPGGNYHSKSWCEWNSTTGLAEAIKGLFAFRFWLILEQRRTCDVHDLGCSHVKFFASSLDWRNPEHIKCCSASMLTLKQIIDGSWRGPTNFVDSVWGHTTL